MSCYVDGFIVPVRMDRLDDYRALVAVARQVWLDHGALSYVECMADDVPSGQMTSFPRAVQLKDDEVVVFSWITYESREARDATNAKVMADERLKPWQTPERMPFDGKRMIWGGFRPLETSPLPA